MTDNHYYIYLYVIEDKFWFSYESFRFIYRVLEMATEFPNSGELLTKDENSLFDKTKN
jgi:hypothetical protein